MKGNGIISDINKSRKITITGKYFGNFGGTISVPMSYSDPRLKDYHFGFDVISWTDTKIVAAVYPKKGINNVLAIRIVQVLPLNVPPFPYFYLTIHRYIDATRTIQKDTKYFLGVPRILPYINGIPNDTPLWFLNGRRYDLTGKFVPSATSNITINEMYHPQVGEIWTFPNGDRKIVEKINISKDFYTTYISVVTSKHNISGFG
ncbi:MAG: hypothetical protein MUF45_02800 [Spirosomaceae bacterium]|jgi:hypothetical protein|nr:hypothetical protein [Spirosomataceae bacterium]